MSGNSSTASGAPVIFTDQDSAPPIHWGWIVVAFILGIVVARRA